MVRNLIVCYLLLLGCINMQAQDSAISNEALKVKVSYDFEQLCDYPNSWRSTEWREKSTLILEIGEHMGHSYVVEEQKLTIASLKQFQDKNTWRLNINIHAQLGETFVGFPTKGSLTQVVNLDAAGVFQYTENVPNLKWQLHPEHKDVLGYDCQRATCSFRGRNYEAWFAAAIPLSYGPWKLQGLPGLILEACDVKNEFRFTATGIEHGKDTQTLTWIYPSLRSIKRVKALKLESMAHRDHGVFAADYGITFYLGGTEHNPMPYHPIELK